MRRIWNRKIKNIETENIINENTATSNRFNTEIDERKLQMLVISLSEISNLHPTATNFFNLIKEGVEDSLQRLISREKFKNISLLDTLMKVK